MRLIVWALILDAAITLTLLFLLSASMVLEDCVMHFFADRDVQGFNLKVRSEVGGEIRVVDVHGVFVALFFKQIEWHHAATIALGSCIIEIPLFFILVTVQ